MTGFFRAALCAAAVVCAGNADAATYLKYDFLTKGTGIQSSGITSLAIQNLSFSFVVPISGVAAAMSSADGSSVTFVPTPLVLLYPSTSYAITTTAAFSVSQGDPDSVIAQSQGAFAATACFGSASPALLPTSNFATDQSCSSVKYVEANKGFSRLYSGTVVEVLVSRFDATFANSGLVSINSAIPEPSTWALMLAGFGLTGYALRRRRARVAMA